MVEFRQKFEDFDGVDQATQQTLASSHNLGGLCCGFAMDWIRRKLAAQQVDGGTYLDRNILEQIALDQALQVLFEGEGPAVVAGANSLVIADNPECRGYVDQFGDSSVSGEPEAGVFYVCCSSVYSGEGHGFGVDSRAAEIELADVGSGIYVCTGGSFVDVVLEHFNLLRSALRLTGFFCYRVTLDVRRWRGANWGV